MHWMTTLAALKASGARVMRSCANPCKFYVHEDLDDLIAVLGADARLHGERPPCPRCPRPTTFFASPGDSTPFRPLLREYLAPDPTRPPGGWPPWPGERCNVRASATALGRYIPAMTDDELERKARAEYEANGQPGQPQIPWADLAEFRRIYWRETVVEMVTRG